MGMSGCEEQPALHGGDAVDGGDLVVGDGDAVGSGEAGHHRPPPSQ